MQVTAALLRWAVSQGQLTAARWEPPTDLSPFVGRSPTAKAVTTPLEVDHILALVRALPDPRWRLGFQLMPDDLPPKHAGFGGNEIRQYLHRRPIWNKLRQDYEGMSSGRFETWKRAHQPAVAGVEATAVAAPNGNGACFESLSA